MFERFSISKTISPFWTRVGILCFRAIRLIKKTGDGIGRILYEGLSPIGRLISMMVLFPCYRIVVLTRLRTKRLALPARGFMLFLMTNKYLFHSSLVVAVIVTVGANLQTPKASAQDTGRQSIGYQLWANSNVEMIHEDLDLEAMRPNEKLLGVGTIEAIPHVDFLYETPDTALEDLMATIPGTVAILPVELRTGETTQTPIPTRTGIETYTVKVGDTLGGIARSFGIDVGTILWANNLSERQYIRPGDTLKILPMPGVLVTVRSGDTLLGLASKYGTSVEKIMSTNGLASEMVPVGKELILPGGVPPVYEQNSLIATSQSRERLNEPGVGQVREPGQSNIQKPADKVEAGVKTALLWPTSGHVITQYYSWRHTGLDVDGDYTSPLYASEDGVVQTSGWNPYGYGLQVLIVHDNGMKTRYAHASKLFVKAGERVKRGQVIAMMGSTGRSTGSHIHYEVYVGGKRVNPLLYIR